MGIFPAKSESGFSRSSVDLFFSRCRKELFPLLATSPRRGKRFQNRDSKNKDTSVLLIFHFIQSSPHQENGTVLVALRPGVLLEVSWAVSCVVSRIWC